MIINGCPACNRAWIECVCNSYCAECECNTNHTTQEHLAQDEAYLCEDWVYDEE